MLIALLEKFMMQDCATHIANKNIMVSDRFVRALFHKVGLNVELLVLRIKQLAEKWSTIKYSNP